jgi:hypothetical protein
MTPPHDEFFLNELRMGPSRRWTLNGIDLTSGSHFQVRIASHWIDVVVECDGREYYAIPYAVRLHAGLPARFISEWAE